MDFSNDPVGRFSSICSNFERNLHDFSKDSSDEGLLYPSSREITLSLMLISTLQKLQKILQILLMTFVNF